MPGFALIASGCADHNGSCGRLAPGAKAVAARPCAQQGVHCCRPGTGTPTPEVAARRTGGQAGRQGRGVCAGALAACPGPCKAPGAGQAQHALLGRRGRRGGVCLVRLVLTRLGLHTPGQSQPQADDLGISQQKSGPSLFYGVFVSLGLHLWRNLPSSLPAAWLWVQGLR